jgi:hypothetical protein
MLKHGENNWGRDLVFEAQETSIKCKDRGKGSLFRDGKAVERKLESSTDVCIAENQVGICIHGDCDEAEVVLDNYRRKKRLNDGYLATGT